MPRSSTARRERLVRIARLLEAARADHFVARDDVVAAGLCEDEDFDLYLAVRPRLEPILVETDSDEILELVPAAEIVHRVRVLADLALEHGVRPAPAGLCS